jgi:hypothetical protein
MVPWGQTGRHKPQPLQRSGSIAVVTVRLMRADLRDVRACVSTFKDFANFVGKLLQVEWFLDETVTAAC